MKTVDYTYAVSRIRLKETKLFSAKTLDRLVALKDTEALISALIELGYGAEKQEDNTSLLKAEENKLWALMNELVEDMSVFDVFRVQNDFHNLKASIKAVYTGVKLHGILMSGGVGDKDEIYNCVLNKEYSLLPEFLSAPCEKAMDALLKTGDAQLCDVILDRACLEYISEISKNREPVIRDFAELFVDSANIRIAVRGSKSGKNQDFFEKALVESVNLDKEKLSRNAVKGFEYLCEYLESTKYKSAVEYIKKSLSAFEKWCDDSVILSLKPQKAKPFTVGPLFAYIVAKLNEIKAVRLIMIGKENGLEDTKIRERLREMYV